MSRPERNATAAATSAGSSPASSSAIAAVFAVREEVAPTAAETSARSRRRSIGLTSSRTRPLHPVPMPLRNRVTPLGEIVTTAHRGTLMGNRGVLHDESGTLVREWQVRRWIACRLEFKGRRRALLQPRRWTELFFLDEATAIAAGHRPCAECRREDYRRWQAAWAAAGLGATNADAMDLRLHADRTAARPLRAPRGLPDGALVLDGDRPWLVLGGELLAWDHGGYGERRAAGEEPLRLLTPACSIDVFRAGYTPAIHPSARHP